MGLDILDSFDCLGSKIYHFIQDMKPAVCKELYQFVLLEFPLYLEPMTQEHVTMAWPPCHICPQGVISYNLFCNYNMKDYKNAPNFSFSGALLEFLILPVRVCLNEASDGSKDFRHSSSFFLPGGYDQRWEGRKCKVTPTNNALSHYWTLLM